MARAAKAAAMLTTYVTALIISYQVMDEPVHSMIWFESYEACQVAMDDGIAMPLYNHLYELYGNDIMMSCHKTEVVSKEGLRPKLRPEN